MCVISLFIEKLLKNYKGYFLYLLVTQILFNFALMKIDDLFINNNKTTSEELKISEDSLIEPLVQSADIIEVMKR